MRYMRINDAFLKACKITGGQTAMAAAMGITTGAVNQIVNGRKPFPVKRAPTVERITKGAVRCEDLAPDVDWSFIRGTAAVNRENPQNSECVAG